MDKTIYQMNIENSILREQLRQQERKAEKRKTSQQKKKENYFKSLNKKKNQISSDVITADEYKKLNDDSAKRKAYNNLRKWFHIYIKARDLFVDVDGKIKGRCIACNKIWVVEFWNDGTIKNPELWCASHYFLADRFASVEFDESNVNLSCYNCNRYLSGNLALYKINLVKKIGKEEFELLENRKNETRGFNILEMTKLKERFMDKTKQEIKRLGIKL